MRTQKELPQPWIKTSHNPVLIPTFSAPGGVARFEHFIHSADRLMAQLSPAHAIILCAILYEGIGSYEVLSSFLNSLASPMETGDGLFVQWTDGQDRLYSHVLDPRTRIALSKAPSDTSPKQNLSSFPQVLLGHYPKAQEAMSKDIWSLVFHDAMAWLHHHVPNFCLGMVTGDIRITALHRDVLARLIRPPQNDSFQTKNAADDDALSPAYDQALETLLEKDGPVNRRARCLKEIQDLFSLPNRETDIRLSNERWRASMYGRLAFTADLIARQGTEGDALILLWVHHLLSIGSLRLKNPSVATIARYVGALSTLISENYTRCTCSAIQMNDEQWLALFDAMKKELISDPQRPALASFHQFCIQVFGAPPIARVLFAGEGQATRVNANTIWPHEIHQALELAANVSNDARVCASVQALLALAAIFPLRIGEAQALRLDDFLVTDGGIELRFHPRRGHHRGKSYSAKRLMRSFGAPAWLQFLNTWLERRMTEEFETRGKSALLFGDPHRNDHTYLFATCSRLVNRVLKQVCGDSSVSFHTLRHAWVNRAIIHHLSHPVCNPSPVSWLEELAAQVGHAHVQTTLEHYFHRPDLALRCALNSHWQTRPLSTETIAFWTGRKPTALRKAKQRSEDKMAFFWSCLIAMQSCRNLSHGSSESQVEMQPPRPQESASLMQVRKILTDVRSGLSIEAIASRCAAPSDAIIDVIHHAAAVANELLISKGQIHHCLAINTTTISVKLRFLTEFWRAHGVRPDVIDEPSYRVLALQKKVPVCSQRDAIQTWMRCREARGIALRPDGSADALLHWLHDSGISGSSIVLRIPVNHGHDPHRQAVALSSDTTRNAQDQIRQYFGDLFAIERVSQRKAEQHPYMLIARTPLFSTSERCPPAKVRMLRFHGLMFSIAVLQHLSKEGSHE